MSKRRHTPGPWSQKGISMDDGSISIGPDDLRIVICYVTNAASFGDFVSSALAGRRDFGAPDTAHTQHANARLIAAAPDLYAALLDAENMLADFLKPHEDTSPTLEKMRAAIAKVESRS